MKLLLVFHFHRKLFNTNNICFATMVYQLQSQVCLQKYYTRHDAKIMYPIFQKLPGGIMDSDIHHAI